MTHREWANRFVELAHQILGERLVSAVLFGSVAMGCERPDSDIDLLLVIKDLPQGRFVRRAILDPLFTLLDKDDSDKPFISTVLKTPNEAQVLSPLYFDMVDRGVVLYDTNGFFRDVLNDVEQRLIRLGSVRKQLGKIEYWDLKPDYIPGEIFEI